MWSMFAVMDQVVTPVATPAPENPWTTPIAAAAALIALLAFISTAVDSSRRSRPVMVARLERDPTDTYIQVVVSNFGGSAARKVRVILPSDFAVGAPSESNLHAYTRDKYKHEIPVWAPQESQRDYYKLIVPSPGEAFPPEIVRATIKYRTDWLRRHKDTFDLDRRPVEIAVTSSNDGDPRESLKTIAAGMKALTLYLTGSSLVTRMGTPHPFEQMKQWLEAKNGNRQALPRPNGDENQ